MLVLVAVEAASRRENFSHNRAYQPGANVGPAPAEQTTQLEEKERLLKRLQKKNSIYNSKHPRRRLLTALHGFYRYRQRAFDELSRINDLYGHVPKAHKKVKPKTIYILKKTNRKSARRIRNRIR